MNKTRWLIYLSLVLLVSSMLPLPFTSPVQAGEKKSTLEELTANADSVIEGTVVERSSYWNDEHNRIYTSVALSVRDKFKGTVGQEKINVVLPGGEVDGKGQWVSDMPTFDQGERAIVFLKKLPKEQLPKASKIQQAEEQFEVHGGFRGKVSIKQGKIGNLPEGKFKERVSKVAKGQSLPADELDVPSSPATFPYSYAGYSWPHPPNPAVGYRINENTADCAGEGTAVQTAAATWSSAGARFSFSYSGSTTATIYSSNGVNEILWRNFGSGGTIAHAIIWYSGSTILENDIEFNDYYNWSAEVSDYCPAGRMDVQTIALHELGHWLCLNDLYDAGDAAKVMYGYGSTGTTKRALHSDDIAGIRYIYGVGTSAPTVTNSIGAANITSSTATLTGEVTSTGGENPTVHIYWGTSDGGTTPASWTNDENLGAKGAGSFQKDISSLTAGTTYYYRCYATNSAGAAWAAATASFTTSSSSSWLSGWGYRKRITIAGSSDGAQANYQMKLTINRSTGTDSGSTVYVGTKCASDYKDIRFTRTNGTTLLDYWIESADSSTATVWVEFDSIPASQAYFYFYYGNAGASSASNGANTFLEFDHFDDGSLGTMWTTQGSPTISESGTEITITGGAGAYQGIYTDNSYTTAAFRGRVKMLQAGVQYIYLGWRSSDDSKSAIWLYSGNAAEEGSWTATGGAWTVTAVNFDQANYQIFEVLRNSSTSAKFYLNDVLQATHSTNVPSGNLSLALKTWNNGVAIRADWIFIRKYTANEPTWNAWASEESATPPEAPAPPTLLSPGTAITFKWNTASGATKYQLQVSTSSSFSSTVFDAEVGNVTSYEVTGLTLGTTYYWRVRAGNDGGWSAYSATRSVTASAVP